MYPERLLFVALLCAIAALAPARASAEEGDAAALFSRGNELFDVGHYPEAYRLYERSFRRRPSYDSAANAGICAHKLGRYAEAARLLRYSLDHMPGSLEPSERLAAQQRMEELFAEATTHVVTVVLDLSPPGAEVLVDGKPAGRAPLEAALFLTPGPHRLLARLSGHHTREEELRVGAGERLALAWSLELVPSEADGAEAPSTPVLVFGAVFGTALIATGIALLGGAEAKAGAREDLGASLGGSNPCGAGSPYPEQCEELRSLSATEKTLRGLGVAGLAAGGATLLGTLLYGVWPRGDGGDSSPGGVMIVPLPEAESFGLAATGVF